MSSARQRIIDRVRLGLAARAGDDLRHARVEERLRVHSRGPAPSRASGDGRALRQLFLRMVEASGATLAVVGTGADLPRAVADYLRSRNLGLTLRMGADPWLAAVSWTAEPALTVAHGAARPDDEVGLSLAAHGVAETGTLVLASGVDNPTTLNFLPETHIVALSASRLTATYEDAWDALRANSGGSALPRVINFITGPSRTADIEQTLLMGAHGPRRVHVILIEDT